MREKNTIFGNGKFYKTALTIAVPIMLQQLIQSMVSLIDNFMVSGLGDISMSGVNVAGQILFVFMVFINTICMTGDGVYRLSKRNTVSNGYWKYTGCAYP